MVNDKYLVERDGSKWHAVSIETGEVASAEYGSQYDCFTEFVMKHMGPEIKPFWYNIKFDRVPGHARESYLCPLLESQYERDDSIGINVDKCKTCEYCSRIVKLDVGSYRVHCTYPRVCRSATAWPPAKPGDPVGPMPLEFK